MTEDLGASPTERGLVIGFAKTVVVFVVGGAWFKILIYWGYD